MQLYDSDAHLKIIHYQDSHIDKDDIVEFSAHDNWTVPLQWISSAWRRLKKALLLARVRRECTEVEVAEDEDSHLRRGVSGVCR